MTEKVWREITVNEKTLRMYLMCWIAITAAVVLLVNATSEYVFPTKSSTSQIQFILAEIGYIAAILFAMVVMKKNAVFPKESK